MPIQLTELRSGQTPLLDQNERRRVADTFVLGAIEEQGEVARTR